MSLDTQAQAQGRPRVTTASRLSRVGLELFIERGFDATTMDDIAVAAGVGRRTVFRYFPSKNDLPWGDFDAELRRLRRGLEAVPADVPMLQALREAIIEFNTFPPEEAIFHRARMHLILEVPALVAHSALRYEAWRAVIAWFVGSRTGLDPQALEPQVAAYGILGASVAAYERWLADPDLELGAVFAQAFDALDALAHFE